MFTEITQLKHLIINPPPGLLDKQDEWSSVCNLIPCTFIVPPEDLGRWRADWTQGGQIIRSHNAWPPVRANIKAVLSYNQLQPHEAAYLTHDEAELPAAINSRVGTLLWGVPQKKIWPDMTLNDPDRLVMAINGQSTQQAFGYHGEVKTTLSSSLKSAGKKGLLLNWPVDDDLADRVRCFALGRYFPTSDARYHKHQYTQRTLEMKDKAEPILASALTDMLKVLNQDDPVGFVTSVPPKPNRAAESGLPETIELACKQINLTFRQDALVCVEDYPSQRDVPPNMRRTNVQGKFRVGKLVRCSHAVVVDDVTTSGSTLFECARQILNSGVERVTLLAFGLDQKVIAPSHELKCSDQTCDGVFTVRFRGDNRKAFWGCTQFPQTDCRRNLSWETGLDRWNRLNTLDDLPVVYDVRF